MKYYYTPIVFLLHSLIYFGNKYSYSINWPLTSLSNQKTLLPQSPDSYLPETSDKNTNVLNSYLYNGSVSNLNKNDSLEQSSNTKPLEDMSSHHVKVVTVDETDSSKIKENDTGQYTVEEQPLSFNLKFKNGVKCVEVKYDNQLVWEYDKEFGDNYPKELLFQRKEKMVTLNFSNFNLVYQYSDGKWRFHSRTQFEQIAPSQSSGGGGSTSGVTPSAVPVETSKVKDKVEEQETKQSGELENNTSNNKENKKDYQKDVNKLLNVVNKLENYLSKMTNFLNYKHNKGNKLSNNLVNVLTLDGVEGSSTKVNDTTKYTVNSVKPNKVHYKFNDGVKCVEVKYDNQLVWKHDFNQYEDKFPTELQVHLDEGYVVVFSGDDWHCDYKFVDKKFELDYYRKKLSKSEYPPEITIVTVKESGKENRDKSVHDQSELNKNNLKKDEEDEGYTVNKYYRKGKSVEFGYSFNDGVKCVGVKYDNQLVWEYDNSKDDKEKEENDNKYPNNVTYVKDDNVIVLVYQDEVVAYKKSGDKWVVDKEEFTKDSKELRPKTQYVLDDALILVLMLCGLSFIIALLVLLLAGGFMYLVNKRAKLKMEIQQNKSEFVV